MDFPRVSFITDGNGRLDGATEHPSVHVLLRFETPAQLGKKQAASWYFSSGGQRYNGLSSHEHPEIDILRRFPICAVRGFAFLLFSPRLVLVCAFDER